MSALSGAAWVAVSLVASLLIAAFGALTILLRYRRIAREARIELDAERREVRNLTQSLALLRQDEGVAADGGVRPQEPWPGPAVLPEWVRSRRFGTGRGASDVWRRRSERISLVADPVTTDGLRAVADVAPVSPRGFRGEIRDHRPSVLLVVWPFHSFDIRDTPWRALVGESSASNPSPWEALGRVLDYCDALGIPTVLWITHGGNPEGPCAEFELVLRRVAVVFAHDLGGPLVGTRPQLSDRVSYLGPCVDTRWFHPVGRRSGGSEVLALRHVESSTSTNVARVLGSGADAEAAVADEQGKTVELSDYRGIAALMRVNDFAWAGGIPVDRTGPGGFALQAGACGAVFLDSRTPELPPADDCDRLRRAALIEASSRSMATAVRTILRGVGAEVRIDRPPPTLVDVVDSVAELESRLGALRRVRPGHPVLLVVKEGAVHGDFEALEMPGRDVATVSARALLDSWAPERLVEGDSFYRVGDLSSLETVDLALLAACLEFPVPAARAGSVSSRKFSLTPAPGPAGLMVRGSSLPDLVAPVRGLAAMEV